MLNNLFKHNIHEENPRFEAVFEGAFCYIYLYLQIGIKMLQIDHETQMSL